MFWVKANPMISPTQRTFRKSINSHETLNGINFGSKWTALSSFALKRFNQIFFIKNEAMNVRDRGGEWEGVIEREREKKIKSTLISYARLSLSDSLHLDECSSQVVHNYRYLSAIVLTFQEKTFFSAIFFLFFFLFWWYLIPFRFCCRFALWKFD